MARLPDPSKSLSKSDRAEYERMAAARGEDQLGEVYLRMWNNPPVARLVGRLGEHLRYHGVLPGEVRELAILRFAQRTRLAYEWAHHEGPAKLAGLADETLAHLAAGRTPPSLTPQQLAALGGVDAVLEGASIPEDVQHVIAEGFGTAGVVELVALLGLYGLIGSVVTSFDIALEPGRSAPF
jgi:4-carboxymuconolactone decarboxylase